MTPASRPSPAAPPWGVCEILLVAERTRGRTHRSFAGWRFEAVLSSGRPRPGACLVAVAFTAAEAASAGWRHDVRRVAELPGRTAFAWTATDAAAAADPFVAAAARVRGWLLDHGWEQDPLNPTRYHG